MSSKTTRSNNGELEHILAEARQLRVRRGNLYRDQALKILPWICAWCGREFTSKKLHELTVHHKDRNHNNNPPDGSNWELLCMYCHDSEHSRSLDRDASGETALHDEEERPATYNPFAVLKKLVKKKEYTPVASAGLVDGSCLSLDLVTLRVGENVPGVFLGAAPPIPFESGEFINWKKYRLGRLQSEMRTGYKKSTFE